VKLYMNSEIKELRSSVDPYVEEAEAFLGAVIRGGGIGHRVAL